MENNRDKEYEDIDLADDGQEYALPDDSAQSEEAMEVLRRENLKGQYDFINLIVLAFVMILSAAALISMTSSTKFSDEGNKLTVERLLNGEYTAEIQQRYDTTIPFTEQLKWLEERFSLIYGLGNKVSDPIDELPEEIGGTEIPDMTYKEPQDEHHEQTITTADEEDVIPDITDEPEHTLAPYKTTFTRTTTHADPNTSTTTTTTTAESTTTTNNDSPGATSTTTLSASPTQTTTTTTAPTTTSTTTTTQATTTTTTTKTTTTTTTTTAAAEPPETTPTSDDDTSSDEPTASGTEE